MPRETGAGSLHRLIYRSRSNMDGDESERALEVDRIVEHSEKANANTEITGVLLIQNDIFVQVLEGPRDATAAKFEDICRDFRHQDIQLLSFDSIEERMFPNWRMTPVRQDTTDLDSDLSFIKIRKRLGKLLGDQDGALADVSPDTDRKTDP